MSTPLAKIILRILHPRGKRGYLHSLTLVHKGVVLHTAAIRYHYRLDMAAIIAVEEDFRTKTGSIPATTSVTPLDEYSHDD